MGQGKIGDLTLVAGTAFKDAELKHVGDKGTPLCEFALIVGKKEDGKGVFANCKAWGKLAKYAAGIVKGDMVCVAGKLESREYNGKTYNSVVADWMNVIEAGTPTTSATPSTPPRGFSELDEDDPESLPF